MNGGTGVDTLQLVFSNAAGGAVSMPAATVSNVEVFDLRNVSGQTLNVDAAQFAGETQVNADRSTNTVTITNLGTGAAAGVKGNGSVTNGALNFGYAVAADAAVLNVSGGTTAGAVAITTTPTAVTINSTGASNTIGTVALGGAATGLTVNAASNLTTGNITGFTGTAAKITVAGAAAGTATAAAVSLGTLEAATVATVDASGLTAGGVALTANANTSLKVTGGAGQDIITTGTALVTGSVDAAGGTNDRLVVTANGVVNNATNAGKFVNFEQIQANAGVTDVDLSLFSGMTAVRINDGAGAVTVSNLNATQAAAVSILATDLSGLPNGGNTQITIGVKNATNGGQIDTVKAALTTTTGTTNLVAQNIDLSGITLAGVEKLELTGNGAATATTGAVYLDLANATAVDSIVFSNAGNGNILNVGASAAANLNVNAAGSAGSVTINASAYNTTTGATLTTGAGNDTIYGSAKVDTIVAGAGNDNIYGDGVTFTAEVQQFTVTAAATAAGSITVGGVATAYAGTDTETAIAAKVVANKAAIIAANTNIADITNTNGVVSVTYKATAGDVALTTASVTAATGATVGAVAEVTTGATSITAHAAADTLTGGDGNDTFFFKAGAANTIANMATITDLNLGTSAVSGQVDKLTVDLATPAANATLVTLTDAQKSVVTAATTLALAADAVASVLGGVAGANQVAQFTYGSDTYLMVNGVNGGTTYDASNDIIVKITGVTGTLDGSDIVII